MALLDTLGGRYRPNVLFVGAEHAAEAALKKLSPQFAGPIATCLLPGPLRLPGADVAALIIRNVGALNFEQQSELLKWLESGASVPVVSLSPTPLFALVASGAFSERLYHRLNTVLEHVDMI